MNFWGNILRYPRFFLSSMVGLFLVLITPIIKLSKEIADKKFLLCLFLGAVIALISTLNLMINSSY